MSELKIERFSMGKEVFSLVLFIVLMLFLGFMAVCYFYTGHYIYGCFLCLGAISWGWHAYMCASGIATARKWIKIAKETPVQL